MTEQQFEKLPKHIAIVMDGNGRWAKKRLLPRIMGHRKGVDVVKRVLALCRDHHIENLSLFAFSTENWSRPEEEVSQLMTIFLSALREQAAQLHENNIRLRVIGNRQQLSSDLQTEIANAERLTANNDALNLYLCANYGGHWDILNAAQQAAQHVIDNKMQPQEIDESLFQKFLQAPEAPFPDLLIRTSGEQRISNFFLWQLAYSELFFCEKYWPDFAEQDFMEALTFFAQRKRRYGKLDS